mmetsp:Transcript_48270/g.113457  ORF Transcript_48270/g.113457 Transcript_48270/m.113457 type:complete len:274 (-) Transcript_48270:397-1218(-)
MHLTTLHPLVVKQVHPHIVRTCLCRAFQCDRPSPNKVIRQCVLVPSLHPAHLLLPKHTPHPRPPLGRLSGPLRNGCLELLVPKFYHAERIHLAKGVVVFHKVPLNHMELDLSRPRRRRGRWGGGQGGGGGHGLLVGLVSRLRLLSPSLRLFLFLCPRRCEIRQQVLLPSLLLCGCSCRPSILIHPRDDLLVLLINVRSVDVAVGEEFVAVKVLGEDDELSDNVVGGGDFPVGVGHTLDEILPTFLGFFRLSDPFGCGVEGAECFHGFVGQLCC